MCNTHCSTCSVSLFPQSLTRVPAIKPFKNCTSTTSAARTTEVPFLSPINEVKGKTLYPAITVYSTVHGIAFGKLLGSLVSEVGHHLKPNRSDFYSRKGHQVYCPRVVTRQCKLPAGWYHSCTPGTTVSSTCLVCRPVSFHHSFPWNAISRATKSAHYTTRCVLSRSSRPDRPKQPWRDVCKSCIWICLPVSDLYELRGACTICDAFMTLTFVWFAEAFLNRGTRRVRVETRCLLWALRQQWIVVVPCSSSGWVMTAKTSCWSTLTIRWVYGYPIQERGSSHECDALVRINLSASNVTPLVRATESIKKPPSQPTQAKPIYSDVYEAQQWVASRRQPHLLKRVIVTPAVYTRLVEFFHFDIQSTGQKSHCVNTRWRPSRCFVLIKQLDSPGPHQFKAACLTPAETHHKGTCSCSSPRADAHTGPGSSCLEAAFAQSGTAPTPASYLSLTEVTDLV